LKAVTYIWKGVGSWFVLFIERKLYVVGALLECGLTAIRPSSWSPPVRNCLTHQILVSGVRALPFTLLIAVSFSFAVYLHCNLWLTLTGKPEWLVPALRASLLREAGPLLATFVVMCISVPAIMAEMVNIQLNGELAQLQAKGQNTFGLVVMPRMIGLSIAIFCLSIFLNVTVFLCLEAWFLFFSPEILNIVNVFHSFMMGLKPADFLSVFLRAVIIGNMIGAICANEARNVRAVSTEAPTLVGRAMLRCLWAAVSVTFIVSIALRVSA
jgi:phospholipid/cholesterol/gamma-HCH transport system permease protein